jgi:DNA replication and repair protein RecF
VIEYLELKNFRNFRERNFQFNSGDIVLSGPNGSGKSSVLESLGYLSILRSFRGARSRELVTLGEHTFELKCRYSSGRRKSVLCVKESSEGKRELVIGGASPLRTSDFIKEFRCVAFVPEDREIVSGASGCRRRFFDMMISSIDHSYLKSLSDFNRALMQRNRALKCGRSDVASHFDTELAERSPEIASKRLKYAEAISSAVNELMKENKSSFEIRYLSTTSMEKDQNLFLLKKNLEKDKVRKCTSFGPQLDEFEFRLDGKIMRSFCSTGQKGIVALMLKLAEFSIVKKESSVPVAVLADDVLCDLDQRNSELFLDKIQSADQRFFTFASVPAFGRFTEYETIGLE